MATSTPIDLSHRRRRLTGRDPGQAHRTSTPLELFYDLTIVVAIGVSANQLADYIAADHIRAGVIGFLFTTFGVVWAWVNYSWFASAYDTDDWVFRLGTMVQMVGVIVLALGIQQVFTSLQSGSTLDNGVMVGGYVVMRLSMLFFWWRVWSDDPERRTVARTYMTTIAAAQAGWVTLVLLKLPIATTFLLMGGLLLIEFAGPAIAERKRGGTPWHIEHIAERYGLLVIITLGEGIIGTTAALNALVHGPEGWTVDVVLVAIAGVGLTFGSWWMYFTVPWAEVLAARRNHAFIWAHSHIPIFASLAATGAGLRVASSFLGHQTRIGPTATVLSVAIPITIYTVALYATYSAVIADVDPFHIALLLITAGVLGTSIALAAAGVEMPICLLVLMLAPLVTVIGFEVVGFRHAALALERAQTSD